MDFNKDIIEYINEFNNNVLSLADTCNSINSIYPNCTARLQIMDNNIDNPYIVIRIPVQLNAKTIGVYIEIIIQNEDDTINYSFSNINTYLLSSERKLNTFYKRKLLSPLENSCIKQLINMMSDNGILSKPFTDYKIFMDVLSRVIHVLDTCAQADINVLIDHIMVERALETI